MTGLVRVCFSFAVSPEDVDEYVRRHSPVPRPMLETLRSAGIRDYAIFLAPDGALVGTYLTADPEATRRFLAESEVAAEWSSYMAPLFKRGPGGEAFRYAVQVFDLDSQLDQ